MSEYHRRARRDDLSTYQHQHAEHSCLSSTDDEHAQLGMRDRLWMSDCERCGLAAVHCPQISRGDLIAHELFLIQDA